MDLFKVCVWIYQRKPTVFLYNIMNIIYSDIVMNFFNGRKVVRYVIEKA